MAGVYWSEMKAFIHRNKRWHATVRYYDPTPTWPHKITICDFDYPRRKSKHSLVTTGWSHEDWFRESQVVVGSYFNGMIPMYGFYGEDGMPHRGATALVDILLDMGTLLPTEEVREWQRRWNKPIPMTGQQSPSLSTRTSVQVSTSVGL